MIAPNQSTVVHAVRGGITGKKVDLVGRNVPFIVLYNYDDLVALPPKRREMFKWIYAGKISDFIDGKKGFIFYANTEDMVWRIGIVGI